jgi:predicted SAM-dependent methyltransferase
MRFDRSRILGLLLVVTIGVGFFFATTGYLGLGDLRAKDAQVIREYLESHSVRKLQLGAGGQEAVGWLNSDIAPAENEIYLDATARFPFPDGSFQYVFSEHVIEHVPWEGGLEMLKESHRVLAPGGKIRIVTPNLTKFIQLLGAGSDEETQKIIDAKLKWHDWPDTPVNGAYIFNKQVREWGHVFLYDSDTLRKTLELAGFEQITEYHVDELTDPVFREAEARIRDKRSVVRMVNAWEAMAFEAVR